MQVEKLLMAFKVIHLLFYINGCRLLMNVESKFDVLVFQIFLSVLTINILDNLLVETHSVRIFE